MNGVISRFKSSIRDDGMPISKMIFEMSVFKCDPNYQNYCIVEGKSDVLFYTNINVEPFCDKKTAYIFKDYAKNDNVVGKSAVVSAFISFGELFKKEINRCIFIVDHDYDGLDCKKYGLPEAARNFINVLPVYSFENFFMNRINMQTVFRKANLQDHTGSQILKSLMDIKRDTIDYFAYKCVLTLHSQEKKYVRLRKIHFTFKEAEIFRANIRKDPPICINAINAEIENMKNSIDEYPELIACFEATRINFLNDDENRLIKGKVLLQLLRDLIYQLSGLDISESNVNLYSKIVSALDVDFKPVFAQPIEGKRT